MISKEQKNINILNRFESKIDSISVKKYIIKFTDGRGAVMLCNKNEDLEEATQIARSTFNKLFLSIE